MKFALACLLLIGTAVQTARGYDTSLYQDIEENVNEAIKWVKEVMPSMSISDVPSPDIHVPETPGTVQNLDFPSIDETLSDMGDGVDDMVHGAKNMANKAGDILNGAIDGA